MADTPYVDTKKMSSRSFAFALHSKDGDVLDAACSASVTQRGLALSGGAASVALGVLTWAKLLRWAKLDEKRVSLRVATPVTKDFVLAGAAARRGAARGGACRGIPFLRASTRLAPSQPRPVRSIPPTSSRAARYAL